MRFPNFIGTYASFHNFHRIFSPFGYSLKSNQYLFELIFTPQGSVSNFWMQPVAYAGFWKGGGGKKFQKIWEKHRSEFEIVTLKIRSIFSPKTGEEQK